MYFYPQKGPEVIKAVTSAWKLMSLFSDTVCMFFSETLPVEYLGGRPLCMNQYYEVLSSCRIPGLKKDSVVNHAKSSRPPKHIAVVHNSQVRSWSCPICSGNSIRDSPFHVSPQMFYLNLDSCSTFIVFLCCARIPLPPPEFL